MQIVLLHISHIVTSAFFPHNCARASRISSQYYAKFGRELVIPIYVRRLRRRDSRQRG